ncbi:type I secretion system ATPase, partial [Novosphingobium sp. Rr 2-17]
MTIFPETPGAWPLRKAFGACRGLFVNAGLFSAFLNLLYLAPSIYMLQVYDRVVPTRGVATLGALTGIFVLAIVAVGLLELVRNRLLLRAGFKLDMLLAGPIIESYVDD